MRSLRHKIGLILGLSCLLALLAGVGLSSFIYQRQVRRQSTQELSAFAAKIPASVEGIGEDLLRFLKSTSLSADLADHAVPLDTQFIANHVKNYVTVDYLNFVEFTNRFGVVVWSLTDQRCVNESSDNPLVGTALSNGVFGTGVYRCQGEPFIIATSPVIYGSNYVGTITIGQKLNQLELARLENHSDIHLAFWNHPDKEALASTGQTPLPAIGYLLDTQELQCMSQGQIINKRFRIRNHDYQAAFFTHNELSPGRQDFYAVYRSLDFLNQANREMLFHVALMTLFVLAIGGWFAWWISLRVTDPLAKLSQAARHLAALDFSERVEATTQDEIGDLANSISFLSSALQENIAKKDHYAGELAGLNVNLERQVAARTEDLVHAKERLEREIAEKEDFLRAISHDLGAPLRNIAGLARLLERRNKGTLGDDGLEMIGRISNNVKNELSMIEMLLELSRIKTLRGKFSRVQLPEIVRQIRDDLSFSIDEKRLKIIVQDGLPTVWAEENRIRQLFQNLIDNAVKYIGDQPQPQIIVGWSEHPAAWMFWVSDNGIGIPADQKQRIFGVFRRVRSRETGSIEGKGVGLASVKTIVEMYGGEIWVESELGHGSTFYFTLNRSQVDLENRREEELEDAEASLTTNEYAHPAN